MDVYLQYNLLYPNLYDFAVEDIDEYFEDDDEEWEWYYRPSSVPVNLSKQTRYKVLTR